VVDAQVTMRRIEGVLDYCQYVRKLAGSVASSTLILNQNIRGTLYYEWDLTDKAAADKVDKIYINMRTMF
jgi:hypothetical protein